jgi:D-sedoheptulose 7-phosphate isomerase
MREKILKAFEESAAVKLQFVKENVDTIIEVSKMIADSLNKGGKLLLFGNGGSSTDASHIAAEFVNRFLKDRPPFPAIALNTDMAVITSISNDYDFSEIFARQLKALAQEGDVVLAISTSGNSPNVLKAMDVAKKKKLKTIAFTGAKGDKLASKADYVFAVATTNTPRIQETHITLGHVICQMVEEILLESHRKK